VQKRSKVYIPELDPYVLPKPRRYNKNQSNISDSQHIVKNEISKINKRLQHNILMARSLVIPSKKKQEKQESALRKAVAENLKATLSHSHSSDISDAGVSNKCKYLRQLNSTVPMSI
jgi:hypothetical protein